MKILPILFAFCFASCLLTAQSEQQLIKKRLAFPDSDKGRLLSIQNISGDIEVTGYDGTELILEVTKTIDARQAGDRAKGMEEVNPEVVDHGDVILIIFSNPCSGTFAQKLTPEQIRSGWSWEWKDDCSWNPPYDHRLDYKIKVPRKVALRLSTVNNGDIAVSNIAGTMNINNVNGHIRLEDISGATKARTVNGNVDIRYTENPDGRSTYYSLNGNINAYFRPSLSAKLYFKTFNGEMYTDLEQIEPIRPQLEKRTDESGKTRYSKTGGLAFQVGSGAVELDFETFNGDVYIHTK